MALESIPWIGYWSGSPAGEAAARAPLLAVVMVVTLAGVTEQLRRLPPAGVGTGIELIGGGVLGYVIALGLQWYRDNSNYRDFKVYWLLLPSENLKTRMTDVSQPVLSAGISDRNI